MRAVTASLADIVERVETDRQTLRVCNVPDGVSLESVEAFVEPDDLELEIVDTPTRPAGVVDLIDDGGRIASSPLAAVRRYARAWEESTTLGLRTEPPAVLTAMQGTTFESYDKRRMVMASRIVEFRAWNAGSGTLHAGFQQLSKLDYQPTVYRTLAASDVDVHVYGEPDREPLPDLDVTVHRSDDEEVRRHWWVAYDGDGNDETKVVLLAQERAPNRFYGFWTERAHVVDDVLDRMTHLGR